MDYEFCAKWSRFPEHEPPSCTMYLVTRYRTEKKTRKNTVKRTLAIPFICRAFYLEGSNQWMDPESGKTYDNVIAWMPCPKPCEPLPDDYWHPDQIYARQYMGQKEE